MHPDEELKRLRWRAHHRGIREADILVGSFFDAHASQLGPEDCAWLNELLEEQDVDIIAWATGTAEPPERFQGPMLEALRKLDYVPVAR